MSLEEKGFLSPEVNVYRERIRDQYAAFFELVERAHELLHAAMKTINIQSSDDQKMLATCLIIKLKNDIQGSILLAERGLSPQAAILVRTASEALIILAKTCQSADFATIYRGIMRKEVRAKMKNLLANQSPGLDKFRGLADQLVKDVDSNDFQGVPGRDIKAWAAEDVIGLSALYDATYRMFSDDVHCGPTSLSRYVRLEDGKETGEFVWGPDAEPDVRGVLVEGARVLIGSLNLGRKLFGWDINFSAEPLEKWFRRLLTSIEPAGIDQKDMTP